MTNERMDLIKQKLTASLQPSQLEIIDQSQQHAGHAGAKSGGGHFQVSIASDAFEGKSRVQCHQLVYQAIGDAIGKEIHALSITILR